MEQDIITLNEIKTLDPVMKYNPNEIFMLQDGRIGVYESNREFKVFDPNHNYHCDISKFDDTNNSTLPSSNGLVLPNGHIVSYDESAGGICIYKISKNNYEKILSIKSKEGVGSLILISNNRFATCEVTLNIWKGSEPYYSTPL